MEGIFEESGVGAGVAMKPGNKVGLGVFLDRSHFVFALVDSPLSLVFTAIGHGVADGEAAHEFGNTSFVAAGVFG